MAEHTHETTKERVTEVEVEDPATEPVKDVVIEDDDGAEDAPKDEDKPEE